MHQRQRATRRGCSVGRHFTIMAVGLPEQPISLCPKRGAASDLEPASEAAGRVKAVSSWALEGLPGLEELAGSHTSLEVASILWLRPNSWESGIMLWS